MASSDPLVQSFRVPDWLPMSMNRLMRMHHRDRNRQVQFDKSVVRAAISNAHRLVKASGRREVRLLFQCWLWSEMPDGDNALKALTDALVDAGLLLGDTFREMRWGLIDGGLVPVMTPQHVVVELADIGPVLA